MLRSFALTLLVGLTFLPAAWPVAVDAAPATPVGYTIHIDPSDISGIDIEMRFLTTRLPTRIAMAAHPEYDDKYYRYIENLQAKSDNRSVTVTREQDAVWRLDGAHGAVVVKYRLRFPPQERDFRDAWKPFLTPTGGMVGDLHTLMYVVGGEGRPARLTLDIPAGWKAASGLVPTVDPKVFNGSTELMLDSPVMIGDLREWKFTAGGVPHSMVIWSPPDARSYDHRPLLDGVKKLAEQAVRAFGRPPYPRYTFLFQQGGQAALEHMTSVNIGLSLDLNDVFEEVAHEYIHVWNLMDVRPRERVGIRYRFAEPTGVLWWNEGATIMFADLLIRRAGLVGDRRTRVQRLESIIGRYMSAPGYSTLPAELVSRGDSHPLVLGDNSTSTHLQGEVLTTMLDFKIRDATDGRRSATDVMRLLAARFDSRHGITNQDIANALAQVCGCEMGSFFREHIHSGNQIDFDRYLGLVGMRTEVGRTPAVAQDGRPAVDLRIGPLSFESKMIIRIGNPQSAWGRAGLHTGDEVVSVGGQPSSTWLEFRSWLRTLKVGDTARLEVKRDGVNRTFNVHIEPYDIPTVRLFELPNANAKQLRLRAAWMNSN